MKTDGGSCLFFCGIFQKESEKVLYSFGKDVTIIFAKPRKRKYPIKEENTMFWKAKQKQPQKSFDRSKKRPVIRASICTGEQTACFQNLETGKLEEIMLLRTPADRAEFLSTYGIQEEELQVIY
jgi:hypothetical protein